MPAPDRRAVTASGTVGLGGLAGWTVNGYVGAEAARKLGKTLAEQLAERGLTADQFLDAIAPTAVYGQTDIPDWLREVFGELLAKAGPVLVFEVAFVLWWLTRAVSSDAHQVYMDMVTLVALALWFVRKRRAGDG